MPGKNLKPKVLFVDDDQDSLSLLKEVGLTNNFDSLTATNGKEALEIIKEHRCIMTVVTDIMMPVMDGITLIEECRLHHPLLPVVAITGFGDVDMAVKVMKSGAFDFLSKPIDINILVKTITKSIDHKRHIEKRWQQDVYKARLAALGELSTGISQEIKNSLKTLDIGVKMLKQSHMPRAFEEYLHLISSSADRISEIVENSKSLSRIKLAPEPVNVRQFMIETCVFFQYELRDKNITLDLDVPEDLPSLMLIRPQMEQTILSILTNASHAVGEGGKIAVKVRIEKNKLAIEISDTGTGITHGDLQHIFRPFFTTKEFATGLGLACCKEIVEHHGGTISVSSSLGKGSIFTISFPLEKIKIP